MENIFFSSSKEVTFAFIKVSCPRRTCEEGKKDISHAIPIVKLEGLPV